MLWLVWLCWLSCATPFRDGPVAPSVRDWHQLMEEVVGPGFDDVLMAESSRDPEQMNYALIVRTASNMADGMTLGYGELERKSVPEFSDQARRTEIWLREIVDQARAHRGLLVRELVAKGEGDYCAKCHDATGEGR